MGLVIDRTGTHFDAYGLPISKRCWPAIRLMTRPFSTARAMSWHVWSPATCPNTAPSILRSTPPPGYVLVIDQTMGDASIRSAGPIRQHLRAKCSPGRRQDHPDATIVVKTHPETQRRPSRGALRRHADTRRSDQLEDRSDLPLGADGGRNRCLHCVLATGVRGDPRRSQTAGLRPALLCRMGPDRGPQSDRPPQTPPDTGATGGGRAHPLSALVRSLSRPPLRAGGCAGDIGGRGARLASRTGTDMSPSACARGSAGRCKRSLPRTVRP
jgi:hypothetical protein